MKIFLRFKHWQLFSLLVCTYFGFKIVGNTTTVIASHGETITYTEYSPLYFLFIAVLFGWFYTIGVNLTKKLPDTAKMNMTKFKLFMLILIFHIFFFYMFVHFRMQPNTATIVVIVILNLFSMFCIPYCIYFNAKALKTIELQRLVTFRDYVGEFFFLLFFPIGIWIIQPRINKIFDATLQVKEQI